mgnify:CR=1 FL=1
MSDAQPPKPSTMNLRSGDLVNQSTVATGLVGALLSPFINGGLKFITDHAHGYLTFGDGYSEQLTAVVVVLAMYLQGRWHMSSIRKADAEPEAVA